MAQQPASDAIIRVRDITVQFGNTRILDGLNLDVKRGEILGFVGPSGAGKSVLTRTIIGLVPKLSGRIEVFGVDLDAANTAERRGVERRWGVLFQQGALFSSLTVRQNIQFPVREYLKLSQRLLDEMASPHLGIVLDPANLLEECSAAASRAKLDEALDLLGADVLLAHAKDRDQQGAVRPPGQGVVDFRHFVAGLDGAGFGGAVVMHGFAEADVAAAVAHLRPLFEG